MSPVSIWSLLQADHDEIWDLLAAISGGADAPPDNTKRQRHLAKQLVAVQSAHEFAEERVVLPLVRAHCADGAELAEEVLSQEKLLKRSLNELMAFAAGTPEFEECVNTIAGENRNHLTYEQNQVWPRLQDALSADQLDQLSRDWYRARRTAPTRAHPHLPPHPALLATLGVALGRRDRAVDALRRMSSGDPLVRLRAAGHSDGPENNSTKSRTTRPSVP